MWRSKSRSRIVALIVLLWIVSAVQALAQLPQAPTNVTVNAQLAQPAILGLSVSSGPVGTAVTITGANFGQIQGTSTVRFNGTTATVTSWSSGSLATSVPAGATTGNVVVTVASQSSNGSAFTVTVLPPTVTITAPSGVPTYDAGTSASITVAGTASSTITISGCTWTNSLGGSGAATGTTNWSETVPLTVGSNVITETCTDTLSQTGNDVITITRAAGGNPTNPISSSRQPAGDASVPQLVWGGAGVPGGIPSAAWALSTSIAAYTGSATAINNAIAACGTNQYVQLGAGTFTLTSAILFSKSNCELRGMGASSTFLFMNQGSGPGSRCGLGGFTAGVISFCNDVCNIGTSVGGCGGVQNSATINASPGYNQGRTTIVLSSITNLTVGSTIFLDMLDTNTDGYPLAGDTFWCGTGPPCSAEGDAPYQRTGRTYVEPHIVVSCGTAVADAACSSTTVVIDPPIIDSTFRASQTPGAWWGNPTTVLRNSGLRDFSLDYTAANQGPGILMVNATHDWVEGVRIIFNTGPGQFVMHIEMINGFRNTIKSNYFYGPTSQGNTQYTYAPHVTGSVLFENNILHRNVSPIAVNDTESGSVYGYNYTDAAFYSSYGHQDHSMTGYTLHEGNNYGQFYLDSNHGPHYFQTFFRNQIDRTAHATDSVSTTAGFAMLHHSRFPNFVGNVIYNGYTTYQNIACPSGSSSSCGDLTVFTFGWTGNCGACDGISFDSNVNRTAMRWGNWNNVTAGAANMNTPGDQTGTRWCIAPLPANCGTGAGGTGAPINEVPSGITSYANAAPTSQVLPSSLYLSASPSFFQSIAWPPIGPDVTAASPIANSGAHANKIPSRVCFETAANDGLAAYLASNPRIRVFSRVACYGAGL